MKPNQATPHPILIGCSGWSYTDWVGAFYPEGMTASDFLSFYTDRFDIVEVDSTFYRPPPPQMVRGWYNKTPDDFKFALKVPQVITHQKQLRDCQEEVDGFVSAIAPLREKLFCALLQMGYFNKGAFNSLDDFLPVLDDFLAAWPHRRVPLAVEIRNPRWVVPAFVDVLRKHNAALTLTEQKWMPTPEKIVQTIDPVTGPLAFVRLIGDREGIEKITQSWDKLVVDRSVELEKDAQVIRGLAEKVPVAVFVANHFAGHAPATIRDLRALLDIEPPKPPERPRTTLFD